MARDADARHEPGRSVLLRHAEEIQLIVAPAGHYHAGLELFVDALDLLEAVLLGVHEVVHSLGEVALLEALLEAQVPSLLDEGDEHLAVGMVLEVFLELGHVEWIARRAIVDGIVVEQQLQSVGDLGVDVPHFGFDLLCVIIIEQPLTVGVTVRFLARSRERCRHQWVIKGSEASRRLGEVSR